MKKLDEEQLKQALVKKAVGYDTDEEISEFVVDEDGKQLLCKKKVTKKHFSPDLAAIKLVYEKFFSEVQNKYESMSLEQLLQEKARLMQLLEEEKKKCK